MGDLIESGEINIVFRYYQNTLKLDKTLVEMCISKCLQITRLENCVFFLEPGHQGKTTSCEFLPSIQIVKLVQDYGFTKNTQSRAVRRHSTSVTRYCCYFMKLHTNYHYEWGMWAIPGPTILQSFPKVPRYQSPPKCTFTCAKLDVILQQFHRVFN